MAKRSGFRKKTFNQEYNEVVRLRDQREALRKKSMPTLSDSRQRARIDLAINAIKVMRDGKKDRRSFNISALFVDSVPGKLSSTLSVMNEMKGKGSKHWQEKFLAELSSRNIVEASTDKGEKFWGASNEEVINIILENHSDGDSSLISALVFPKEVDFDAELKTVMGEEPTEIVPVQDEEELEVVEGDSENSFASRFLQALETVSDRVAGQTNAILALKDLISSSNDKLSSLRTSFTIDTIKNAVSARDDKLSQTIEGGLNRIGAEFNGFKKGWRGIESKLDETIRLLNAAIKQSSHDDIVEHLSKKLTDVVKDATLPEIKAIITEISAQNTAVKDSVEILAQEVSDLNQKLEESKQRAVQLARVKRAVGEIKEVMGDLNDGS